MMLSGRIRIWSLILWYTFRNVLLQFLIIGSVVSGLIGAAQLVKIIENWHPELFGEFFALTARKYNELQSLVFDNLKDFGIPKFLKWLGGYFHLQLELPVYWRDVATLLSLYMGAHVKEAFYIKAEEKDDLSIARIRWSAFLKRLFASLFAIFISLIVSSVLDPYNIAPLLDMIIISTIGITIYRIGFAWQFASDLTRRFTTSFYPTFRKKLIGVSTITLGALIILTFGFIAKLTSMPIGTAISNVLSLFSFILFLAWFHVSSSIPADISSKNTGEVKEAFKKLETTGHFNIGIRILFFLLLVSQIVVVDALSDLAN